MLCSFRALRIIFIYIAIKEWDEKKKDGVTVFGCSVFHYRGKASRRKLYKSRDAHRGRDMLIRREPALDFMV